MKPVPGPLVTVVLTSYNHGAFIEEALQSVLDQSVRDLEVLCIDDASTDATAAKLAAIDDPRLRVIAAGVNRGFHHRNVALRQARGAYIAFQNSDDLWRPGKLAAQLAYLAEHPECGACFTAVDLCDEEGRPCPGHPVWGGVFTVEEHARRQWLKRFYDLGNCLALPSAVVSASWLRRTELMDPSLFLCGDWDLWVQIAAVAELHVISERLTVVRIRSHGRNLSAPGATGQNRASRETIEVLRRFTRPPIVDQLEEIFGEAMEPRDLSDASSGISATVRLGLMAASSRHRHHRLAAIEFLRVGLRRADLEGGLSERTRSRAAHRLFEIGGELDAQAIEKKCGPPDWIDLVVQLFWRFQSGPFSEEQSIRIPCTISTSLVRIPIDIPALDRSPVEFRLDPADRPARLLLRELSLHDANGQPVWRLEANGERGSLVLAMIFQKPDSGPGILIQTFGEDPQWFLPIPPSLCHSLAGGGTLELVVQLAEPVS